VLVNALNSFATVLEREAIEKKSAYHFEKHMRWVTTWYQNVRNMSISSVYVTKRRKVLRSDPNCNGRSTALTDSYHPGDVWKALLAYESNELQQIIDDCGAERDGRGEAILTDYANEQVLLFARRAFIWCTRCFNCARSSDAVGLRTSRSFTPTTRRGTALELHECATAAVGSVIFFDTKTAKGRFSEPHNVFAPRRQYVGDDYLRMSYWYRLSKYMAASASHRKQMHTGEHDHLLISSKLCKRKITKRMDHATGKRRDHVPDCGGECNHYHPLSSDAIAKDTKWCLALAGAETRYKAHSTRGCSEMCIIYGGRISDQFGPDEARLRARHSEQTQKTYYARAVNPRWLMTIRKLRKGTAKNMYPEEFILQWD
jgi:hypothetical protein